MISNCLKLFRDSFHKHYITHIDCVTIIIYNILATISTLKTTNALIQFEYFYITKNKCESTLQALNGTNKDI